MRLVYSDGLNWPRWFRITGLVLGLVAVLIETLYQGRDSADGLYFQRTFVMNLGHPLLYGCLAVAAALAFSVRLPNLRASALIVLGIGIVGWLDEWHQTTLPFRDASTWDLFSDMIGAVFALMVAGWSSQPGGLRGRILPLFLLFTLSMIWNIVPTLAPEFPPPTP